MQDKEIIEKMGGVQAVCKALNFSYQRVFNWTKRGIPPKIILENQEYFKQAKDREAKTPSSN